MSVTWRNLGVVVLAFDATFVLAQDVVLKLFVLASKGPGDVAQKVQAAKSEHGGFGVPMTGEGDEKNMDDKYLRTCAGRWR